ncbi:MAG TPA: AsmA family protein, partial [Spirochaetota bacterium]
MKRVKKITKATFKYFIIPVTLLIFLLVLSAGVTAYFFPKKKIVALLSTRVESVLSKKVRITDIRYRIGGLSLQGIQIMDSPDSTEKMISADEVSLRISYLQLFRGNIEISGIRIKGLRGVLQYEKNQWNIESLITRIKSRSESTSSSPLKTQISYIAFENAVISLKSTPANLKNLIGEYDVSGTLNAPGEDPLIITDLSIVLPDKRGTVSSRKLTVTPLNPDFRIKGDIDLDNCELRWLYKWGEVDFLPFTIVTGTCSNSVIGPNEISG